MNRLSLSARRELASILALTLFGAVVRFWSLGEIGLTHFDEGVYALSGLWSQMPQGIGALDPMLIPYAPPGLPLLIGLAYAMFGVADASAVFVSMLCGTLTIPAAAWVARRTFGPGAGAAAAVFVAASLVHIAFSRHALTDAPFLLAWILAIGVGQRFLERPSAPRALLLALGVAGAQYLKYNGWLAGIIVLGAAVLGAIRPQQEDPVRRLMATFGFGLLAALLAAALYWPWFQFVERHGGYAALIQHHRSYLGAEGSWIPYWSQQLAQNVALSWSAGWRAVFGILAIVVAWVAQPKADGNRASGRQLRPLLVGVIAAGSLPAALANLSWWIGLAWCPWLLIDARPTVRMLGIWWLLLSVLTPLYHPYARLWLPLHGAGWILLAGAAARAVAWLKDCDTFRLAGLGAVMSSGRTAVFSTLAAGLCLIAGLTQEAWAGARPFPAVWFFEPTSGLRGAVSSLAKGLPKPPARPVRVLARRPVAFYLLVYAGSPFVLEPSLDELRQGSAGDQALVDQAVIGAVADPITNLNAHTQSRGAWQVVSESRLSLDPVTLLDTFPGAVDPRHRGRTVSLWYLIWNVELPTAPSAN